MGDWYDYFERFPDENPANQKYVPDGPSARIPSIAEQRAAEDARRQAREAVFRQTHSSQKK